MNSANEAINKFKAGYTCSQAVISKYCEQFHLERGMAMKLAAGFSGGMCTGKTCGAVSGAIMVLGLKFSDEHPETPEGRQRVYTSVFEFSKRFEQINGSTVCRDLLGYDIGTSEGLQAVKDQNLFQTFCPKMVASAVELLATMTVDPDAA